MEFDSKDLLAQHELQDLGFYKGPLDGLWGQRSEMALQAWKATLRATIAPPSEHGDLDPRTETNIATLRTAAQVAARKFMAAVIPAMAVFGLEVRITSGNRSYEEQEALYAQGRTAPGPIVTNARAGCSNHNFGIAWDITLFKDDKPLWESPHYRECAEIGKEQGLDCGAFWSNLQDEPHYNLKTGYTLAQLRQRQNDGLPIP